MTGKWPDLVAELDSWGESGQVARLWWRDDDAVAPTFELRTLLQLRGDAPLALAVIPARADADLPALLEKMPQVTALQHGWRHDKHTMAGAKKSEFPAERPEAAVAAELADGRAKLTALFGPRALPVFVPPWNRFADRFVPLLTKAGIRGLSAMASRNVMALTPNIALMDVHIDLVAWKDGKRFVGTAAALSALIHHLQARRRGYAVHGTVVGILTHHLVMDRAGAGFVDRLVATVDRHPAVRWASAEELLVA